MSTASGGGIRPLVMRCGAFGDMVLLTPLIRALHARFGQPVDIVSSGPWTLPLLEGQPGVGEIFLLESRKTPYWFSSSQRACVKGLRARGPGPAWFCDPGVVGRDLLRRGGIPDDLVCEDSAFPWVAGEHFVDRWIRFATVSPPGLERFSAGQRSGEGGSAGTRATRTRAGAEAGAHSRAEVSRAAVLEIRPAMRAGLEPWLAQRGLAGKPLILIQAGNKRTMRRGSRQRVTNTKYWPEENWASVIRALRAARPDHAVLLLGVPAEFDLNREIAQLAGVGDVHNVADDLPIHILLPLLERASSMVSVDTGPAHAAAALGCPTVALFGASDPRLYRPGGVTTPAAVLTGTVDGKASMLGITPDSVIDAWRRLAG
jgi:ADP-heptose:LPS heptosyltransferase